VLLGRILAVGSLPQSRNAGIHLTRLERGKAANDVDLDTDLLDPVADLELAGPILQALQPREFECDRRGIAQRRRTQRTRIGVARFGMRVLVPWICIG
jgi:hypothetical protein